MLGKNGKDNPAKITYEIKNKNREYTGLLFTQITSKSRFCFNLSKLKISSR